MTLAQTALVAFEILVSLLLIWGFIHEDKVIAFEKWITMVIVVNYRRRQKRKLARKNSIARAKTYDPMVVHRNTHDSRGKVA